MIVSAVAKAAAAATVGILALQSGRNMVQTYHLSHRDGSDGENNKAAALPTTVSELQQCNRQEILNLYLHHCQPPTNLAEIDGEWDGVLLANNGLTRVTKFVTNRLFGKNRRWNGKAFDVANRMGTNRFDKYTNHKDNKQQWTVILRTDNERKFEFDTSPESRLFDRSSSATSASSAIVCTYRPPKHDNTWLWNSMRDEIRILPIDDSNTNNIELMLGIGSLAWSGGTLNGTPFCLYRKKQKQ